MKLLTIFTPTYNRKDLILRLYNSLKEQSCKNFIWLIIDDGSTDGTGNLIQQLKDENVITIIYIYQNNSGKHVAHNKAVQLCQTILFMCVDSDDFLRYDAVEVILKDYENEHWELTSCLGGYYRRGGYNGATISDEFPSGITELKIMDLYDKFFYHGDTAIVLKTQYAKTEKFPVFYNEKFVTESVYYRKLNNLGIMKVHNIVIYYCEYQNDGYSATANKLMIKNPYGTAYGFLQNSIYFLDTVKAGKMYSQFLAFKKIFKLSNKMFQDIYYKNSGVVKMLGFLFYFHYYILYKKIKNYRKQGDIQ